MVYARVLESARIHKSVAVHLDYSTNMVVPWHLWNMLSVSNIFRLSSACISCKAVLKPSLFSLSDKTPVFVLQLVD